MSHRMLVAVDHSDESLAGLRHAVVLARADRAELTLVHVAVPAPCWGGVGMLAMPVADDVEACACRLLHEALAELPDDLAVRWFVVGGPEACAGLSRVRCVRRALTTAMQRGHHDLLVMGTGVRPGRVARGMVRQLGDRVLLASHGLQPATPAAPRPAVVGEVASRAL
jgi:nucleotide-binding universal stress UspA family protein